MSGQPRLGAEKLEKTVLSAGYWHKNAHEASNVSDSKLYFDNAVNHWKNAAYHWAEESSKLEQQLAAVTAEVKATKATCDTYKEFNNKLASEIDEALVRIKASQEQEPVGVVRMSAPPDGNPKPIPKWLLSADQSHLKNGDQLYAAPVIPPTEAELLAKIERLETDFSYLNTAYDEALNSSQSNRDLYLTSLSTIEELTRKMAEQQALFQRRTIIGWLDKNGDFVDLPEKVTEGCKPLTLFTSLTSAPEELTSLLVEERKKAVPEGWKLVPIEPTEEMCNAALDCQDYDPKDPAICEMYALYNAMLSSAPQPEDKA